MENECKKTKVASKKEFSLIQEKLQLQLNEITSERDTILKDKNDQAMQFQNSALQVNKVLQERESAIQGLKGKLEPLQRENSRLCGEIEEGKKCMFCAFVTNSVYP